MTFYCFQLSVLCSSTFNVHGELTEQATIKISDNSALTVRVWGFKSMKKTRRYSNVTYNYSEQIPDLAGYFKAAGVKRTQYSSSSRS